MPARLLIGGVAALLLTAASATAAWTTPAAGGSAAARAAALPQAGAPSATKSGIGTVTVSLSWPPVPGATGYLVARTGGIGSLGGTCTGTLTTTSCSDGPLLTLQTYSYTVTAVHGGWTGPAGPATTVNT